MGLTEENALLAVILFEHKRKRYKGKVIDFDKRKQRVKVLTYEPDTNKYQGIAYVKIGDKFELERPGSDISDPRHKYKTIVNNILRN